MNVILVAAVVGLFQTVSGPYTHDNLDVFLVHGAEAQPGKTYLTLQEGMEKKVVKVHETGSVNELSIENVGDAEVFVQSGEIVKGGRQDRVLSVSMILPAKSGRIPIASFCVEQSRWRQRGSEQASAFSKSDKVISTKSLKVATRKSKDQGEVWKEVAANQDALQKNTGGDVKSAQSASSYQLTLEHGKVKETTDAYVKKLAGIVDGKTDVIGFAFAINGKVNSADLYGTSALFRKLWPKLIEAAAVEAISEKQPAGAKAHAPATIASIEAAMADGNAAKTTEEKVYGKRAKSITKESDASLLLETTDTNTKGSGYVHRSLVTK